MNAADPNIDLISAIDTRGLAELEGPERAFVSLYLGSPAALEQLQTRADRVRAFLSDEPEELEHFERSFEMIEDWLGSDTPAEFEGLAIFASWALGFVKGYVLPLSVPDLLRVEASPYLRPIAELQDEYETFAIVAADNGATRIFVVTSALVDEEERISGGIKNQVKKGGWSQKRYDRRRDNALLHYAKKVIERLQELEQEHKLSRIVLLGSEETMREILEAMPQGMQDRVVGEKAVDLDDEREVLVDEAFEVYFDAERRSERDLWDRIKETGISDGLAATGATDVLQALAVGRVQEILVHRDAKIPGTRCRDCETLVHGTPETCQVCGSASVFEVDLVAEFVRLAETTSASVDFADPLPGLERAGHVAALLRY